MKEIDTDVLVIGAGLVGLLAAHCLSTLKYKVVIIDKKEIKESKKSLKDIRTVAVSEGSKQFLDSLSLWSGIKGGAETIKKIKVFDRSFSNKILFQNFDNDRNLGYVVQNAKFNESLLKNLRKKKNVKIFYNSKLVRIDESNGNLKTYLENKSIKSRLVVAADGKNSDVRKIVGNKIFKKNYPESALVLNFLHDNNLHNTAYEIFYNSGPLAILPMGPSIKNFQSSIIWSNKDAFIKKLMNADNRFLSNFINEKVGFITGNIIKINSRQKFPLSAHINDSFINKRLIYIGDSAHSIHPIAGQGWNLGVKDVKNLNTLLNEFVSKKKEIGNEIFCKKYNSLSYKNAFQLYQITDKLNSHFKRKEKIYRAISNLGFNLIENNKKLKESITKYAMGF